MSAKFPRGGGGGGAGPFFSSKSICDLQKNETIFIFISLKRYFSHPEKSILNLSLP